MWGGGGRRSDLRERRPPVDPLWLLGWEAFCRIERDRAGDGRPVDGVLGLHISE